MGRKLRLTRPHGARAALVLGVPLVALSIAGIAAAAFAPALVRDHPLALLFLESRNRYLLLVNAKVSLVPFVVVGTLRRLASDPFYYLLGRWYGERAVALLRGRVFRNAAFADRLEGHFARLAGPAVFLFPGALTCLLAGTVGMPPRRFALCNVAGTILAVVGLRLAGNALAGPLQAIVAFNDRNASWLTAVFVTLVVGWLIARRRKRPLLETYRDVRRLTSGDDGD